MASSDKRFFDQLDITPGVCHTLLALVTFRTSSQEALKLLQLLKLISKNFIKNIIQKAVIMTISF